MSTELALPAQNPTSAGATFPAGDAGSFAQPQRKLRVGLFVDAPLQPRWLLDAMIEVSSAGIAEFVVIADGGRQPQVLPWLWRAYAKGVDGPLFGSMHDPSLLLHLKAQIPHLHSLTMPGTDDSPADVATWRARIRDLCLDIAFSTSGVSDDILDGTAKFGVWRFWFGAKGDVPEVMAGVRETAGGIPVTASGIKVRLDRSRGERLVYRSWSRTFTFSVVRGRQHLLRKTSHFAHRAIAELHRSEAGWLRSWTSRTRLPAAQSQSMPGGPESLLGIAAICGRIAYRGLEKILCREQWFLAYRFAMEDRGHADLNRYRCLIPPRDRFWADPFPLRRDGNHFIFFEELVFAERKARISVVEVDRDGIRGLPVLALERDYHLSYPFLIEHDGELFMVPESGDNRTVELYRCVDFPHGWKLESVLLRGRCFTDATLHQDGGRWWMFVNVGIDGGEAHDELHLYHAPDLLGPWEPHVCNPVKSDVRSARPAGRLYRRDGVLFRPAQICAPLYGSGVSLNRVVKLTTDAYSECEQERILPRRAAGLLGVHTLNRADDLCVIDGFMQSLRLLPGGTIFPARSPSKGRPAYATGYY